MPSFDVQTSTPAARTTGEGIYCPFCGGQTAKRSFGDAPDDSQRLELYCDNSNCDVREMAVIALRAGPDAADRADVLALTMIDQGTPEERAKLGFDRRTMTSAPEQIERAISEGARRRANRTRPTSIRVSAHPTWGEAIDAIYEGDEK